MTKQLKSLGLIMTTVAAIVLAEACSKPAPETLAYEPAPRELLSTHTAPQIATIYYLPKAKSDPLAALDEAADKLIPGLRVLASPDVPLEPYPSMHPLLVTPERDWVPDAESLKYFGRGLSQRQIAAVQETEQALSVAFYAEPGDMLRVRALSMQIMAAVVTKTGGLLWDDETREMYSLEEWRRRSMAVPPATADVSTLVTSHAYRDGELIRIVTLGMRSLGYPDVVVNDVPGAISAGMNDLIFAVCQTLVERGGLDRDGKLDLDVNRLAVPVPGGDFEFGEGGDGRVGLDIAIGEPEEGDPDNRIIEIVFPGPASTLAERQAAALVNLWGLYDTMRGAPAGDRELEAASRRARKKLLSEIKPRWQPDPPPLHALLVKAPFAVSGGGSEYMWVEVVRWEDTTIRGILTNQPAYIPDLRQGARVEIDEATVFDFALTLPDGTKQGDETTKILMRRQ